MEHCKVEPFYDVQVLFLKCMDMKKVRFCHHI